MLLDHPVRRRDWVLALAAASWPALRARAGGHLAGAAEEAWPAPLAREALALLAGAADHGLDPRDYDADGLARRLAGALGPPAGGPTTDEPIAADAGAALTAALLHFLSDLAFGRVDPRRIHHRFSVAPRAGFDPAAALQAARARGRLSDAVDAAAPQLPLYGQLRHALAAMRALSSHPAWSQPLPPLPAAARREARPRKLEPGQGWAGLAALAERLDLLGDLPAGSAVPARYEGVLVEAVRSFQQRHGLEADGVLGRATLAALEVPPAERARQVALTMERLRWTPLMQAPRMIVINIPEFMLRAYEVADGQIRVQAQMRVIVGEALDHETPLFDERMRSIEFNPYWNVPPSIARAELVPRLRRDPGYWARQGFEFFGAGGADAGLTRDKLDAVLAGQLRIRQRPGPANALGDIKFVFPNTDHIFLHHTPTVGLFARERRDFSHGCIRVEEPVALARFVMAGMPGWDEARIRAQMAAGSSTTIPLAEPIPVLIAYGTVLVKNGRIHFYNDLYGHDAHLQDALTRR